jgi:hypothetical protein
MLGLGGPEGGLVFGQGLVLWVWQGKQSLQWGLGTGSGGVSEEATNSGDMDILRLNVTMAVFMGGVSVGVYAL